MGRKKTETPQDDTHKALALRDAEEASRQIATEVLEGDLPYERNLYVNEVRFYLQRSAESIVEAGKRLLVLKEREGYGSFMAIISEDIGISHTTALRFMNAALKVEKYPQIKISKFTKLANLYTLLEAPDEDLKALEEKGVLAGRDMDELAAMSVKDMREMIKKLKTGVDAIIKEEVKGLETEKKALLKEVNRLKAFDPENNEADMVWCIEQMKSIEEMAKEFDTLLRKVSFDGRILNMPDIQARVEAVHRRMEKRFELFVKNWDAFVNGDNE